MKERKPYRIVGAYDSETTNYNEQGVVTAFPILHQLGLLGGTPVEEVTAENVEEHVSISMFRHALDLYRALDNLISTDLDYVPVIMCHNLSFDMYGLSPWLARHEVKVLAKSERKPITFTILDEAGNPALVIWDTLVFTQQSLERMGNDCGYKKGSGEWDYGLVRTPSTPLTPDEVDYAKRDIYVLFAWFGWWLRRNPDIDPSRLAINVVTKTGVVRERRRVRFSKLKGAGLRDNVQRYWFFRNRCEAPATDDELYTMMAATRGGFTFCSSSNASVPYDLVGSDDIVAAFDATSQHPAQLVSHFYPINFKERSQQVLEESFNLISKVKMARVLKMWERPFPVAFYGCFEFDNLRPKKGTVYERCGVFPLASARYKDSEQLAFDEDNGDKAAYQEEMNRRDYCDSAQNAVCAFGKLVSAEKARLYITELTAWEICQCYDFDAVRAVHGYSTGRFAKPSDIDVISVMQFYKAKDQFKIAREQFFEKKTIDSKEELIRLGIAPAIAEGMEAGTISDGDVDATYMGLKADLNAIFGISCSNQYRRPTVLTNTGIAYTGDFGICNAPKTPKVWYQFGQRIVGWSRIAQICAIELTMPYAKELINGDTDSVKELVPRANIGKVEQALEKLGRAVDAGKQKVCERVQRAYPAMYDPLEQIGWYVHEFDSERFCAAWNKAYATQDVDKREGVRRFSFTMAGIPTRRRVNDFSCFIGVNGFADRLFALGWSFADICNVFLGYNVTYAHDIIKLNGRRFPEWGEHAFLDVTDYRGARSKVAEPCALALFPMAKTINDTGTPDNEANMAYAIRNNPNVNTARKLIFAGGVADIEVGEIFK